MKSVCCLLTLALVCSAGPVFAEGWGTVKGKLVVDGAAPELPALVRKGAAGVKDGEICAVNEIPDESAIVNDKGEVANCFVYLYQRTGKPKIHPDLAKPAQEKVVFDNKGCRFEPHALVVRTDQSVNCINTDACGHNVRTSSIRNPAHNMLVSANDTKGIDLSFNQAESLPVKVQCDIHPWMTAYWLVVDHPYAAVSGADGSFVIEKLPAGKHTLRIWQERVGYVERSVTVEVVDGQVTDMGTINVDGKKLSK